MLKEVVTSLIKFTDAEYKAAFETYHPTVETYILPETTEDAAKKLVEDAKNDAGAFDKSAKEKKAEMKFDSSNAQIQKKLKLQHSS